MTTEYAISNPLQISPAADGVHPESDIIDLSGGRTVEYEPWLNLPSRQELARALEKGVAFALHKYAKSDVALNAIRRNIYSAARGSWQALCPIGQHAHVLDFGCGLGGISRALARNVREVTGIDACYQRLQVNRAVNVEQAVHNVRLICGNHETLDRLPEKSIDGLVLNGVLEWVPEHLKGPPRQVQLDFLKACRRLLKDDGWIYVGIENRWGFRYFLGRPDDHSQLLFTSLMPRALANAYSLLRRRKPYRTLTYGPRGTAKLLREAGFESTVTYAPVPDYREFDVLLPLDEGPVPRSIAQRFGISKSWKKRVCESRRFVNRFVPCLSLVAYKGGEEAPPWLVTANSQSVNHIYVKHDQASIWLGGNGEEQVIREVPLSPHAKKKHDKIMQLAEAVRTRTTSKISLGDYRISESEANAWLERPAIRGKVLSDFSPEEFEQQFGEVLIALKEIHELGSNLELTPITLLEAISRISPNANECLSEDQLDRFSRVASELQNVLPKRALLMHGDSKPPNVVITKSGPSFIDWEWAEVVTFPAYDVLKLHWHKRENPSTADFHGRLNIPKDYLGDDDAKRSCTVVHPGMDWNACVLAYWTIRIARSMALYRFGGMPVDWNSRVLEPAIESISRVAGVK